MVDNRGWLFRVRLSPAERAALRRVAEIEETKPTELCREWVRESARRVGAWPPAVQAAQADGRRDG